VGGGTTAVEKNISFQILKYCSMVKKFKKLMYFLFVRKLGWQQEIIVVLWE